MRRSLSHEQRRPIYTPSNETILKKDDPSFAHLLTKHYDDEFFRSPISVPTKYNVSMQNSMEW